MLSFVIILCMWFLYVVLYVLCCLLKFCAYMFSLCLLCVVLMLFAQCLYCLCLLFALCLWLVVSCLKCFFQKNQKVWSLSNVVCLIHMYDAFMLLSQCFILCLNRFLYVYMCLDCCLHAYNVCMSVCHFLMRLSCLSQCL